MEPIIQREITRDGIVTTERNVISDCLKAQYGVVIEKKKINLTAEIKAFGDYTAQIKLTHGVSCSVKVKVVEE